MVSHIKVGKRTYVQLQNYLVYQKVDKLRRKGRKYKYIAKKLRISIAKAQNLFATYDLVEKMYPKKNIFTREMDIKWWIDDCLDCLKYGATEEAKQAGYFRDLKNIYETLPRDELSESEINYIVKQVKIKWERINNYRKIHIK